MEAAMLLVFGSLNADMLFKVHALPRPGETVLCPGYELAAGGKGANQAAAAAKAGARVRMVGHLGGDDFGRFARATLEAAGVDCSGVRLSSKPTAIAVIGIDRVGENQIIVASGANLDTHASQVDDAELSPEVTLLCQNEIAPEATFALIGRAKARGARAILNLAPASPVPAAVLEGLDVLVVNGIEAATASGAGGEPSDTARALARRHGLTCVVTLGAQGAIAVGSGQEAWRIGALAVEPVDTTGAGDAFAGVLAAELDRATSLPDALRRASIAAGLACTRVGAQTSQPAQVEIEARLGELAPAERL
jgi:ribokinase